MWKGNEKKNVNKIYKESKVKVNNYIICYYVFVCKLLWINNYLLCYKLFSVYKSLKRDGKK